MFVEGLNKQLLHQRYQQGKRKPKTKINQYKNHVENITDTVEISPEARRLYNESQKRDI